MALFHIKTEYYFIQAPVIRLLKTERWRHCSLIHSIGNSKYTLISQILKIYNLIVYLFQDNRWEVLCKYSESMICCICYVKLKPKEIEGFFTGYYL